MTVGKGGESVPHMIVGKEGEPIGGEGRRVGEKRGEEPGRGRGREKRGGPNLFEFVN